MRKRSISKYFRNPAEASVSRTIWHYDVSSYHRAKEWLDSRRERSAYVPGDGPKKNSWGCARSKGSQRSRRPYFPEHGFFSLLVGLRLRFSPREAGSKTLFFSNLPMPRPPSGSFPLVVENLFVLPRVPKPLSKKRNANKHSTRGNRKVGYFARRKFQSVARQ